MQTSNVQTQENTLEEDVQADRHCYECLEKSQLLFRCISEAFSTFMRLFTQTVSGCNVPELSLVVLRPETTKKVSATKMLKILERLFRPVKVSNELEYDSIQFLNRVPYKCSKGMFRCPQIAQAISNLS